MNAGSATAELRGTDPLAQRAGGWLVALGLVLFGLRLAGPADLTDNDQERPASYVLDAVQNGHWAIQRDAYDDVASKPPLYTWLSALVRVGMGRINRFTLYLPCAGAVIGMALLIYAAGRRWWGPGAGLLAALTLLLSPYGYKHLALARTDAVFGFTVTLGALAAYRAWSTGRGWWAFWMATSLTTLTKGPLGVLLAAGGLVAAVWERGDTPALKARAVFWPGAVLWLAVVGGWFALAWLSAGEDLLRKQLGRELAGHLTGAEAGGKGLFSNPAHPVLHFLSRFAPWSLAATVGFWRMWRRPAAEPAARRAERFLAGWFGVGLLIFTLAPHKRPDLLLPLIPAAALLAGRELARAVAGAPTLQLARAGTVGVLVLLGVLAWARGHSRDTAGEVRVTRAHRDLARWWENEGPPGAPLTFVEHTLTVQFYLNRHQLVVSPEHAARLLRGDAACWLVTRDLAAVRQHLPESFPLRILRAEPPETADTQAQIWLLANRAEAPSPELPQAVGVGPLTVRLEGAEFLGARRLEVRVRAGRPGARVEVINESPAPARAGLRWIGTARAAARWQVLPPGQRWECAPD